MCHLAQRQVEDARPPGGTAAVALTLDGYHNVRVLVDEFHYFLCNPQAASAEHGNVLSFTELHAQACWAAWANMRHGINKVIASRQNDQASLL